MFREIQPPLKSVAGTGVKASVSKRQTAPSVLSISIADAILKQLGAEKKQFRISVGDGEMRGYIKVFPDPAGGFSGRRAPKGGTTLIKIGNLDWLPDESQKSLYCKYELSDNGKAITITLPSWAFHRGAHPAHTRKLADPKKASVPAGNVTSSLMGDPAPGRSALAGKR